MKKRAAFLLILTLVLISVYINKLLYIEYNVNILDYIKYTSEYTVEERAVLSRYKPLIYGGNINEPPMGIYNESYGQYTGITVDYINALSIELGTIIISKPMVWDQALEALKEGKTNLCDMNPSDERAKIYAFSNPLYKLDSIIVVKDKDQNIQEINDLKGLKIAVQKGDIAVDFIKKVGGINITYTKNNEEALNLLKNNQVDAVAGDEPVIRYYLNELSNANEYRILEKPLFDSVCVLAVPKSQAELIPVLNKAIFEMKRKGILDKIAKKWSAGSYMAYINDNVDVQKQNLNLAFLIYLAFIVAYMIYLWNKGLKLLVDSRTKELNFMKNQLEVTFDGIGDFLVVIGKDLKINNINIPFLEYLKTEKDSMLEQPFYEIPILHDFEKENGELLHKLLSSEAEFHSFNPQSTFELKSGKQTFEIVIYPLTRESADAINLLVMISDVTRARIEEQQLIKSNKMETLGQLSAGVAHELKNPLGIIRNSSFILHQEYDYKDKLKIMALDAIDHSVSRASNIIDNMLKYSRLTHEGKEWVDIKRTILEALELHNKRIMEQGIILKIYCDDTARIYSNNESLKHILMNLIQNALDAMHDGGELDIICSSEGESMEIRVRDSGTGIEKDNLDKVFDPFYTTKPVGKGTGLGLYIVYSEVKKLHGDIRIESEKNKGTTFIVSIPKESGETCPQV
jgi:signal transduction histidine kinase/ABC-type amino acid transport substrate-binding protein